MNPHDIIFFCYSPVQKAFHVETCREHLVNNARGLLMGMPLTYVVVCVYPNWNEYDKRHKPLMEAIRKSVENASAGVEYSTLTVEKILSGQL